MIDWLQSFSHATGIFAFMHSQWGWPLIESVHFTGLCLLVGSVGLFDLRMLGLGRGIEMSALHQLVPVGVAGFVLSALSSQVYNCPANSAAPRHAMTMAGVSLLCWTLIIVAGRLITYFRPPYHWCFFC